MEGNFGGGKIWQICCKTHIGKRKLGKSSYPQTKNYTTKLQHNFEAYHWIHGAIMCDEMLNIIQRYILHGFEPT